MTIGFDGSRAFTTNRTGTENYSFQILKHLAEIDHINQYIVYLRPGQNPGVINVISAPYLSSRVISERSHTVNSEISPPINRTRNDKQEYSSNRQLTERSSKSRSSQPSVSNNNYGWPPNFHFKTLDYSRLWTQLGLAIQTFLDPIDVLFVTAHTLPILHRPGLQTVMVAHDLGAEYLPGMHQLKQRIYLNFITNYQFKSATRVIAVSEATKKDLIAKAGVSKSKISVIYEGIDTQFFTPPTKSEITKTLQKFNLAEQSYFFFLGTIQPRKNLLNLITAFSQFEGLLRRQRDINETNGGHINGLPSVSSKTVSPINNPILVIAGSKGWLSDQIYDLPKELGIEEQVIFTGRVTDEESKCLYSSAAAFTFPSLFEGFGLPILEAFAMNCPVITSNTSSMPEVAGSAAILVDPTSLDQIASALSEITDSKLRQKLITHGHKQLSKFSWQRAAYETLKVLESV